MKSLLGKIPLYTMGIIITCVSIIPFLVLLQIALNLPSTLVKNSVLTLPKFTVVNIIDAWEKSRFWLPMLNSAIITLGALVLTVFSAASASYAIARFPTKLHMICYNSFIFSMAIPTIISIVPLYILMRQLGATNTQWGMILLDTTASLPFAIFLFTNFIRTMPREIEEAAIIDGCSWFSAFWKTLFPLLKPITSTVILINAVFFWNEYGRAVFFLQRQTKYTVPLAISAFVQKYGAKWELMAAAALIGMIPTVTVFLIFQKYYIKGLASGAVKG